MWASAIWLGTMLLVGSPSAGGHQAHVSAATPRPILATPQCLEPRSVDGIGAASNLFSANCLVASAYEPFTIDFDNTDLGVVHNIAVYSHDPALRRSAKVLLRGEAITGPGTAVYVVPSQRPGVFYFHCDTHPTLMFGTFRVE